MKRMSKIGSAIAALVVVAIAVFAVFQARSATAKDTDLTFETSPLEVQVTVDGEQYGTVSSGDTLTVPLREQAEIEVAREGFRPYTSTVEVTPGAPHTITAELHPESQTAQAILEEEHEASLENQATEEYLEEAERAYDEHPILDSLPKHAEFYSAYQGLSDSSSNDFAIHLYLYKGYEDQGRDEFQEWLTEEGYQVENYEVVEHIEDEEPSSAISEEPSWDDLTAIQPSDIEIVSDVSNEGLSAEEVAVLFTEIATTWDATKDSHSTDGLKRATNLMSEDAADTVFTPENPATSPAWREAAQYEARSYPWVTYYDETQNGEEKQVELDICWAWVTETDHVIIDGPRTIEASVVETGKGHQISSFAYEDPDPFVDNSNSSCRPKDAPPAP